MVRLTDERVAAIKAARDNPIRDHGWNEDKGEWTVKKTWFAMSVEEFDALLADLEEAREHRRILRQAIGESIERARDPSDNRSVLAPIWNALAATEEKP